jgi:hypothetical protein
MTAISNVLNRDFIACGADRLLALRRGQRIERAKVQRRKLFALDGLRGAVSYWGFAGLERLNVAAEIERFAKQARSHGALEPFARSLRSHLDELLHKYPSVRGLNRGIGVHVVGYESVNGKLVPELFLLTNFKNIAYDQVGPRVGCSRRSFATISNDDGDDEYLLRHSGLDYRRAVYNFLQTGEVIYFNNGEPQMFTPIAHAIVASVKDLEQRGALLRHARVWRELAICPIDLISILQRRIVKERYRLVGGRTDDLVILPSGQMFSDSGVVAQRWSDRFRR